MAFKHSVRDEWLAHHLGQEKPKSKAALTALMIRFYVGQDSWLARRSNGASDPGTSEVRDGNGKPRHNKHKRRNSDEITQGTAVNAGFKSSRPNNKTLPLKDNRDGPSNLDKILDRPCQIYDTPGKPANHAHRECWVFKQDGKLNAEHKGGTPSEDEDEPRKQSTGEQKKFPPEVKTVNLLHVMKGRNKAALVVQTDHL